MTPPRVGGGGIGRQDCAKVRAGALARTALVRGVSQTGGPQAGDELPGCYLLRAKVERPLPGVRRHVIVVTLEAVARDTELRGEGVQLVIGRVRHEVRPLSVAPRPHRGVHKYRHGRILACPPSDESGGRIAP